MPSCAFLVPPPPSFSTSSTGTSNRQTRGVGGYLHLLHGDLLLASRLSFATQGYCFALARFGTAEDAQHLTVYVDRYLPRPDCPYDQHWAISALLHIDSRTGSEHAARFLDSGDLWNQWNEAQYMPSPPSRFIDELCAHAAEGAATGSRGSAPQEGA